MPVYVALLRAVNVGGTGKLPMETLRAMCVELGFECVQTYIASGNVIFRTKASEKQIKQKLESRLAEYAGKTVGVCVRTVGELAEVLARNPFSKEPPSRTVAIFLDDAPPEDAIEKATGRKDEKLTLGKREIFIAYGEGMGSSKLKIPAAKFGTARNMNTIHKLVEIGRKTS
jgi:uncharacterized protein (DUF1697 family)